jgi:pimeloyl-ACP methyl ester carboxylesterase
MVTLILPGYSPKNKEWAEETAEKINVDGLIRPIFWDHWTNPEKKFKPSEKGRLLAGVSVKNAVNIVASSIGTLVATHVVDFAPERVRKIILCGIPLNDMNEENLEEIRRVLRGFPPENILCFQNVEDPHANYDQAKLFYDGINPDIKLISKPGSDHEYPYFEEFHQFLVI